MNFAEECGVKGLEFRVKGLGRPVEVNGPS